MMVGNLIIRSRIRTMFRSWPDIIAQAMRASARIRADRDPLVGAWWAALGWRGGTSAC
jgi:hypothetical protein